MTGAPSDVSATRYRCRYCGYDLTGLAIGGHCSECGAPVGESLRRTAPGRTSGLALASVICGGLALVICGIIGPVAMILAYMARQEIARGDVDPGTSKPLAVVGFVLGAVATAITVIGLVFVFGLGVFNWNY